MSYKFDELGLDPSIVSLLHGKGYEQATDIQAQAIPEVFAGSDLLASAQTGTGKTASFALPIIQLLAHKRYPTKTTRALILSPTRELAEQIARNVKAYSAGSPVRCAVLVGGVPLHPQKRDLKRKPEIVVATPGRLEDLMEQGALRLSELDHLVLDEADRMLDMGFAPVVKRIARLTPDTRQTLLFSATISKKIAELASELLKEPKQIEVVPTATIADNLEQRVFFVERDDKRELLVNKLFQLKGTRVLVFARTKVRANRLAEYLNDGGIRSEAIHSDKSQAARRRALADFTRGKVKVLVATDVVARGIDVKEISHVVNLDLPDDIENYVHRIGRTARASTSGTALTFCDSLEVGTLQAIEGLIDQKLILDKEHEFHSEGAEKLYQTKQLMRKPKRKFAGKPSRKGNFRGKRSFRSSSRSDRNSGGRPFRRRNDSERGDSTYDNRKSKHFGNRERTEGRDSYRSKPKKRFNSDRSVKDYASEQRPKRPYSDRNTERNDFRHGSEDRDSKPRRGSHGRPKWKNNRGDSSERGSQNRGNSSFSRSNSRDGKPSRSRSNGSRPGNSNRRNWEERGQGEQRSSSRSNFRPSSKPRQGQRDDSGNRDYRPNRDSRSTEGRGGKKRSGPFKGKPRAAGRSKFQGKRNTRAGSAPSGRTGAATRKPRSF